MDTAKRKFTPGGILGAIVGFAFAKYAGGNVLVPIVGAVLIGWTIKKVKHEPYPMAAAVAVQGGHCLWMVVGALFAHPEPIFVVETALFAAGVVWLYFKPRLPAVVTLGTYQAIALVVNVASFKPLPIDSIEARALSVHIVLRVISLGMMGLALRAAAKSSAPAVEPARR